MKRPSCEVRVERFKVIRVGALPLGNGEHESFQQRTEFAKADPRGFGGDHGPGQSPLGQEFAYPLGALQPVLSRTLAPEIVPVAVEQLDPNLVHCRNHLDSS